MLKKEEIIKVLIDYGLDLEEATKAITSKKEFANSIYKIFKLASEEINEALDDNDE